MFGYKICIFSTLDMQDVSNTSNLNVSKILLPRFVQVFLYIIYIVEKTFYFILHVSFITIFYSNVTRIIIHILLLKRIANFILEHLCKIKVNVTEDKILL